jgi:hypothetical protein
VMRALFETEERARQLIDDQTIREGISSRMFEYVILNR